MSRGFGQIERAIIEFFDGGGPDFLGATGAAIAQCATGTRDNSSVRRALKRLEAKGLIVLLPKRDGRPIIWGLTSAAKDATRRKQRRERDRARRQRRKYEAHQEDQESWAAWQRHQDRARSTALLENLLGMLGSAHEGEVINAARLAERERRRLGKTWKEILSRDGA